MLVAGSLFGCFSVLWFFAALVLALAGASLAWGPPPGEEKAVRERAKSAGVTLLVVAGLMLAALFAARYLV